MLIVKSALPKSSLSKTLSVGVVLLICGCTSTTPIFDENFGKSSQQFKEAQRIPRPESQTNVMPSAVEFEKATSTYLGGSSSSGSPSPSSSPPASIK